MKFGIEIVCDGLDHWTSCKTETGVLFCPVPFPAPLPRKKAAPHKSALTKKTKDTNRFGAEAAERRGERLKTAISLSPIRASMTMATFWSAGSMEARGGKGGKKEKEEKKENGGRRGRRGRKRKV